LDGRLAQTEVGSAVEFDKDGWQKELRKASSLKDCEFPASSEIEIGGTREQATITMKVKGLNANMQTDPAAFEAWALALLIHCGVKCVKIGVDPGARGPYYERFLYRFKRFSELFPDHVVAKWPDTPSKALNSQIERFLNQPGPRKEPPDADSKERMEAASGLAPSESDLEKALEISNAFRSRFDLDKVMRQWPVGLFSERVKGEDRIFTGGKSGIDLIGIRGDTLVLFELKKADNCHAGAVSELFFYASVMRDAIGASAIFKFESQRAEKNCAIGPEDILRCSKICAVLLAPRFHPLISEPRLFGELNAATERLFVEKPIHFETVTISSLPNGKGRDFEFTKR